MLKEYLITLNDLTILLKRISLTSTISVAVQIVVIYATYKYTGFVLASTLTGVLLISISSVSMQALMRAVYGLVAVYLVIEVFKSRSITLRDYEDAISIIVFYALAILTICIVLDGLRLKPTIRLYVTKVRGGRLPALHQPVVHAPAAARSKGVSANAAVDKKKTASKVQAAPHNHNEPLKRQAQHRTHATKHVPHSGTHASQKNAKRKSMDILPASGSKSPKVPLKTPIKHGAGAKHHIQTSKRLIQ